MNSALRVGVIDVCGTAVSIDSVDGRNWSTVGAGRLSDGRRVFAKQFRDASGNWRASDLDHEVCGLELLGELALRSVELVPPVAVDRASHTVIYPWLDIVTIDRTLRTDPERSADIERRLPALLEQLVEELRLATPLVEARRRERPYPSAGWAVCPKGIDLRNLGWRDDSATPVFFDCGPVQIAPIEELVAKLMCSALLLDFGHPFHRTLRGPNLERTERLVGGIVHRTHRASLDYELERLWRHRAEEPKARSMAERVAIRPATAVLGRRYWRAMRRWADANVPAATPVAAISRSSNQSECP